MDINEPTDIDEERHQALCPECGADHEVEPCAPGCGDEGPASLDRQHQALVHPDGSTCRDGCDDAPHPDGWAALDALLAKPNGDATRSADVFRLRPIDGLES
jgi:hypothetical protein